ncbi:MAG TPA: hypothetical protein VFJ14_08155 [Nocardioidaceae bacterium]|nr:hypothetical protein [Nocardioidaceae bacterium]
MHTHPINISSLVVGLVFLGLAGSWALREAGLVDAKATGWILPLLLVTAGAVGVAAAVVKNARAAKPQDNDDNGGLR